MKNRYLRTVGIATFAVVIVGAVGVSHVSAMVADESAPTPTRAAITQEKVDARATAQDKRATALQEKKDTHEAVKTEKACMRLSASADKLTTRMTVRQEKLQGWQEDQTEKVAQRKEARTAQLIDKRAKADARRAQHYADLVALADTSEKKAALAAYGDAVDAAVKVRRGVIDENLSLFWGRSKEIIIEEKETYVQQYGIYAQNVDTAIADAETACAANGADAKAISKELRTQLKAGQEESRTTNKEVKDVRGKIGEELRVRRQAINEATKEFKEQVRVARRELVEVFGVDIFGDLDEDEQEDYDKDDDKERRK